MDTSAFSLSDQTHPHTAKVSKTLVNYISYFCYITRELGLQESLACASSETLEYSKKQTFVKAWNFCGLSEQ